MSLLEIKYRKKNLEIVINFFINSNMKDLPIFSKSIINIAIIDADIYYIACKL